MRTNVSCVVTKGCCIAVRGGVSCVPPRTAPPPPMLDPRLISCNVLTCRDTLIAVDVQLFISPHGIKTSSRQAVMVVRVREQWLLRWVNDRFTPCTPGMIARV